MTLPSPRFGMQQTLGATQESIAGWLMRGPAQLIAPPHAGAVTGVVDSMGRAGYAYPEITGYYLQWLAWRAARGGVSPELALRADAAQRWLAHWIGDGTLPPPTRIPLLEPTDDWRNHAVFCFDLAMVLRGLGSAVRLRLIEPDPAVIAALTAQLNRLIDDDGLLNACVANDATVALPQRWSTRRGGFLSKAAAGIVMADVHLPGISEKLSRSAADTYAASLRWAIDSPHDDVHPLLYTFEGILSMPEHPQFPTVLPELASQFDALLADTASRGRIPESRNPSAPGPERLDVVAQTIRVGHLLRAYRPQQPPDRAVLASLETILVENVQADGAVPFAVESPSPQLNVWAAMFAEQAIGFAPRDEPAPSPADLGGLLA